MYKLLLILLVVALISACNVSTKETNNFDYSPEQSIEFTNQLADLYVNRYFKQFPEAATAEGIVSARHDKLTDNSIESIRKWQKFEDSLLIELKKINENQLIDKKEWVTYGFLKEILEVSIELRICRIELWNVNHLSNWLTQYTELAQVQPVGNDTLRKKAIKRWSQLPNFIETEIKNLKLGIELGYTSPKVIVSLTIKQLDDMLALPMKNSPLYNPALRDTNKVFQADWEKLHTNSLIPSLKKYTDFLKNEYLNKARTTISISSLPGGKKNYKAFYRYFTSLKVEPDDVYNIATFYVKLNNAKVKMLGEKLFNTSDIAKLIEYIKSRPQKGFGTEQELLGYIDTTITKTKKKLPDYFNLLPKSKLLIKPVPKNREQYGSTFYRVASMDNKQTATFFIKTSQPEKISKGYLETTIFHETYPGHHIQLGIAKELPKAHIITQFFSNTSFVEGWANYATLLAEEMGLFSSDIASVYFIAKHSKMMVVDAGIHTKGWTREYAINYLLENTDYSKKSATVSVDRIIAWPGQFSTYDTGSAEILELRERAKITLADKFDIKEFHDQVLGSGSITLGMLRQKIDRWIIAKSKKQL